MDVTRILDGRTKLDVTTKFGDKYTKIDQNRTVSTNFRSDGRKNGRDQDFRVFAKTSWRVLKKYFLKIRVPAI